MPKTPDQIAEDKYLAHALQQRFISVRGARTHNLKNIDVDIPRNQLVVMTGLSGSGKSSLAFDTLYAEGQRRYVESLSAYARQFLQLMGKPDVDVIEGLSPAIAIEQKATSHNPRSTVGTVTEIHDYLRLLFARAGTPYCPTHGLPLAAQTVSQMVDSVMALPDGSKLMLLAPIAREKKGEFASDFAALQAQGFVRFRIGGQVLEYENLPKLKKTDKHDIDVVIDRVKIKNAGDDAERLQQRQRLAESFEAALRIGGARALALEMDSGVEHLFNAKFACPACSYSLPELEPRLFSFNSPVGACPSCDGLGQTDSFDDKRVVTFPELSLASGAIKGWDRRNHYYHSMLQAVAAHYGFDTETAFEQLTPAQQQAVLWGSDEEDIRFAYTLESGSRAGQTVEKSHPFEGIIPNMERRWRETDSSLVREELGRLRSQQRCEACAGARLRPEARHVRVGEGEQAQGIDAISQMTLGQCHSYFSSLQLAGAKGEIAAKIVQEIASRLRFLNDVGLNYLSLARSAETLSGGEAQRIRLASQIGSGLTGVMYVLDEPSIGLHQRDNDRLIATLQHLRDLGNSVLVVEHDEDMIRAADFVLDLGPGAGIHGGHILAQGTPAQVTANPASITGQYLNGTRSIALPAQRRALLPDAPKPDLQELLKPAAPAGNVFTQAAKDKGKTKSAIKKEAAQAGFPPEKSYKMLKISGATGNNLKNVTASFPVGLMTCVTGVSGSGKSTLVNDTLLAAAARALNRAQSEAAPYADIEGLEHFDKVISVDQSPIGRTPRSNPATYTGLFTPIRELMADVPTARERGYGPGRFSFNVAQASGGGRCEACQGDGLVKVEMHFLPDVYVPCDICHGARYNRETLEVLYKGKNIADILHMTVEDALAFFKAVPQLARKLHTLMEVGLGYITLGQSATTLSGGEAQRVKLALELSKRDTGRTLYVLDEPTTGLHFADIELLLSVLTQLREAGNTIIVIEHNLDVIKTADWIIDMGPEGGGGGGMVVAEGRPEEVAQVAASFTGQYLRRYLPHAGTGMSAGVGAGAAA
jgi:excinuclease ABC subunit A